MMVQLVSVLITLESDSGKNLEHQMHKHHWIFNGNEWESKRNTSLIILFCFLLCQTNQAAAELNANWQTNLCY